MKNRKIFILNEQNDVVELQSSYTMLNIANVHIL